MAPTANNGNGSTRMAGAMGMYSCPCLLLCLLAFHARAASKDQAQPLADGVPAQATIAVDKDNHSQEAYWSYDVDDRAVVELTVHVGKTAKDKLPHLYLDIRDDKDKEVFRYHLGHDLEDYLFFPVLDRGHYRITMDPHDLPFPHTLQLKQIKPQVTDGLRKAAQSAVDRGAQWLLAGNPRKAIEDHQGIAAEGLVIAALCADRSGKNDAVVERDYLPLLASKFEAQPPEATWNGHALSAITRPDHLMYANAITTLALAEAAPRIKPARDLALRGAEFLLAAQLTERRPKPWTPIKPMDVQYGGWRYNPDSLDSDISVTGWSIVALTACAVADVAPPGTRESLRDAARYVSRCTGGEGFTYTVNGGSGLIRNAIGALIYRLNGRTGRALDAALERLDRNLFAGTQTNGSDDYPLYYAYYATRLHYLRGGFAWEAWRTSTLRQLTKLQNADGSWRPFSNDSEVNKRYATALSVMILRMSLNDVPDYLKKEVKGF